VEIKRDLIVLVIIKYKFFFTDMVGHPTQLFFIF